MAKKSTNKEPNIFKRTIEFVKRPNVTFTSGVVVVAFTIYLLLSFLSFFVTGAADHSEIDAASAVAGEVANSAGRSGAIVADYLINDCFGWSSVLLIPMLLVVALRLMNLHAVSLLKWFISVSFGVVWGSLFFSFILGCYNRLCKSRWCTWRLLVWFAYAADRCRRNYFVACYYLLAIYDISYKGDYRLVAQVAYF